LTKDNRLIDKLDKEDTQQYNQYMVDIMKGIDTTIRLKYGNPSELISNRHRLPDGSVTIKYPNVDRYLPGLESTDIDVTVRFRISNGMLEIASEILTVYLDIKRIQFKLNIKLESDRISPMWLAQNISNRIRHSERQFMM